MTRDTWKAGMIREHNELGGPTSTNLSGTLFALFLAMAVVGAFFSLSDIDALERRNRATPTTSAGQAAAGPAHFQQPKMSHIRLAIVINRE
jgi:hypothetical protein